MTEKDCLVLCGDCGGTNTRLALWYLTKETTKPNASNTSTTAPASVGMQRYSKIYLNENHGSFVEICKIFLKEAQCPTIPAVCVLACAGPIIQNSVHFTNIKNGWSIDAVTLQEDLGISQVQLINDFVAMGYGLLTLAPHEYVKLNDVPADLTAPIATIGAGTGLGECYLTPKGDGSYTCFSCEGGHTDFAPTNDIEYELLNYCKNKFNEQKRISAERIISGPGIATVYEFLVDKFPEKKNEGIYHEFVQANTLQASVVAKHAHSDELCQQAMEIFLLAYGREAGNAILKYLPRGGFYITGGIAAKNLEMLTTNSAFYDAIVDKGRVSPAVKNVPIYIAIADDIGGRGAFYFAKQILNEMPKENDKRYNALKDPLFLGGCGVVIGALLGALLSQK